MTPFVLHENACVRFSVDFSPGGHKSWRVETAEHRLPR